MYPILAHWDCTEACNFRCKFCLTNSDLRAKGELNYQHAKILIDKLYDAGIVFFRILGGEPFFRTDMIKILEYAAKKGMILSFSTNASLITSEIAKRLNKIRYSISYLQMSLYGFDKESYKNVTDNNVGFKKAMNGLSLLQENGLEVTILVVANKDNVDNLNKYYDIALEKGIKEFRIAPEIALGRSSEKSKENGTSNEGFWNKFNKKISDLKSKNNNLKVLIDARPQVGQYLYKKTGMETFYQNCTAAESMIYIDAKGNALPCPSLMHMPSRLKEKYDYIKPINIIKKSFNDVWNSNSFSEFRLLKKPSKNKFEINTNCKYYKREECIPCALTPCNCNTDIKLLERELI